MSRTPFLEYRKIQIRAILSGMGTEEDKTRLSELEAEAASIRTTINEFK